MSALHVLATAVAAASAAPDKAVQGLYKAQSPVTGLNGDLLASRIAAGSFMLVEFYAEWCGHCQHFVKTYEEVAKRASEQLPGLEVVAVNCPSNEKACSEHDVHRYPTIILFPGALPWSKPKFSDEVTALLEWAEGHANATAKHPAAAKQHRAVAHEEAKVAHEEANAAITKSALEHHIKPLRHGRRQSLPVPALDVLAAAKYGLYHDIAAQLSAKSQAEVLAARRALQHARRSEEQQMERPHPHGIGIPLRNATDETPLPLLAETEQFSALQVWIAVLAKSLPHHADGGAAVAGMRELSNKLRLLRAKQGAWLPRRAEWEAMLHELGVDRWPGTWQHCRTGDEIAAAGISSDEADDSGSRGYPCGLWLLFHTALAHSTQLMAVHTLTAIVRYVSNFFGCEECAEHFRLLAAQLVEDMRALGKTKFAYNKQSKSSVEQAAEWISELTAAAGRVKERLKGGKQAVGNQSANHSGGGGLEQPQNEMHVLQLLSKQAGELWPRQKAELWLWAAHNAVNNRLAHDAQDASEFKKLQWPSVGECDACYDKVEVPQLQASLAARHTQGWSRSHVLEYLRSVYCLEPGFECWEARKGQFGAGLGAGEARSRKGAAIMLGSLFLLLACALGCPCCPLWLCARKRRKTALE